LVVDPDAVLSGSITFERLQPITWQSREVDECLGPMQQEELPPCGPLEGSKRRDVLVVKQRLRLLAPERLDHPGSV
jgi:hypothetical protein